MRTSFLALMLALAPASAFAGGARTSPAAGAKLDEGLTALYSLDYPKSRAAARKLVEMEPDNPFGSSGSGRRRSGSGSSRPRSTTVTELVPRASSWPRSRPWRARSGT